jgi:hypothetical protein
MAGATRYISIESFVIDYAPNITEIFHYVFHNTERNGEAVLLSGPIRDVLERSNVKHMPKRYTNVAIFSRHRDACKYYGILMGRVVGNPALPTVVPSAAAPAAAAVSEPPRRMQRMRLRTLVRS